MLSNEEIEQIKRDAEAAYPAPTRKFNDGYKQQLDEQNRHNRNGYVSGAIVKASKAKDIKQALERLVHLHSCEQEGLLSSKPTPQMWFDAVNAASKSLSEYQK